MNSFPVLASQILIASRSRYHWLAVKTPKEGLKAIGLRYRKRRSYGLFAASYLILAFGSLGQNFIYDTQFIQHWWGITPRLHFDTMLAQNVVFPGTPKDLGYLSSLYCQYHWYWKDDVKDWRRLGGIKQLLEYNCINVLRTWEIAQSQKAYIKSIGQEEQVEFKMETSGCASV